MYKKAISPVIATALLLVVAVVSVTGFNIWYISYSSGIFANSEIKTNNAVEGGIGIEVISGETLYIKNSNLENVTLNTIKVGGLECDISSQGTLIPGVNQINITSCLNGSGIKNIVLVSNQSVETKELYVTSNHVAVLSTPATPTPPQACNNNLTSPVYNITNCCELQAMSLNLTGDYQIMNDIDCSNTTNWNSGNGFTSIGAIFTGSLEGNGYTISNLYINKSTTKIGLFSQISGGTIKNFILFNETIDIYNTYSGALAGYVISNSVIDNIGIESSNLNIYYDGLLYLGGLIAYLDSSNVTNSYFNSNITNINNAVFSRYVGGLFGLLVDNNYINNSYSNGNIKGNFQSTGGFYISNSGVTTKSYIRNSYSLILINSTNSEISGFGVNLRNVDIDNCYTQSTLYGSNTLLGFGNRLLSTIIINHSYSAADLTSSGGYYGFGGSLFAGGVSENSYFDSDLSKTIIGAGATAKTTAQMKTAQTFIDAGWDENIWNLQDGQYPTLK